MMFASHEQGQEADVGAGHVEPSADECVIYTESLRKIYRRGMRRTPIAALEELDLRVRQGEIFGFLGPNGAGKSTTIKLLTGLILPTRGRAVVAGAPAGSRDARAAMGLLPENPVLNRSWTAREFLTLSARLTGLTPGDARIEMDRLVDRLELGGLLSRRLGKLSKGQQQLVGLAQALIGNPPLLILDEPMSGLDPMARKRVRDLLLDFRTRGRSVFLSSHILGDIELLCDRVGLIRSGRLLGTHPVSGIRASGTGGMELELRGIEPGVAPTLAPELTEVRTVGDRVIVTIPPELDPNAVVAALMARGGRVLSLTPRGGRLESFVLSTISGGAEDSDEGPVAAAAGGER